MSDASIFLTPAPSDSNSSNSRTIALALAPPGINNLALEGLGAVAPGSQFLVRRFRANAARIRHGYRELSFHVKRGDAVPPVSEWLLDNYYVIEDVVRKVTGHLPWSYYRELPAMRRGMRAGLPRIYLLAEAILGRADGVVTEADVRAAVRTYQDFASLTIGEVWAVPTMLRIVTVETIRRLTDDILATHRSAAQARAAVAAVRANRTVRFPAVTSESFAAAMWDELRRDGPAPGPSTDALAEWVAAHADDPAAISQREHSRLAAGQVTFGNAVTTLRLLDVIDWTAFFEAVNLTEKVLRTDPGQIYPKQDFRTRDRCRQAVEELARGSGRPEPDVARAAVAAVARGPGPAVARTVTDVLLGAGRPAFERTLGYRPRLRSARRRGVTAAPHTVYFGLLGTLTLAVLATVLAVLGPVTWWVYATVAAVGLWPATDLALALIPIVTRRLIPPRVLPKLDWKTDVPPEFATAIVVPVLIGRPDQTAGLLDRLELHSLSNPDAALRYALLTDFTDAPAETMPDDAAIVRALTDGVRVLNDRYAKVGPPRFFVFHRRRQFNSTEGCWMGWERKRGKLEEFNHLLRDGSPGSFSTISPAWDPTTRIRFVLTLDADTVLPRDAARQLIATLAHPLNRPHLSADGRRVEAGYAVLQPRVSFLYRTGFRSWLARFFAGSPGVDPYSSASSDTYMDLFGNGSYTGKGLYDVDAFAATAGRAFPDNRILSHDLIESNYARCGLVTDVEVFDEFPEKYPAYARREHRWVRGDWQLLPWLGRTVPTPRGRVPNVLPVLERWKIVDNLRRSLLPGFTVVLLVLGWTVLPGAAWAWTLFALAPLLFPAAQQVVALGIQLLGGVPVRVLAGRSRYDLANAVGQSALRIIFLMDEAWTTADAVVRTLYRLAISRRHLLEWESAAITARRFRAGIRPFVRTMAPGVVATIILAAGLAAAAPESLVVAAPLLLLWSAAPGVAFLVSRPRDVADRPPDAAEREELGRVACRTWDYFQKFVGPDDHWLPPDNFQEDPLGAVAHRTSPTNIGLYLLSTLAARDLGFITSDELATRLDQSFDTLDRLERYHGHFLNWYDTSTLAPLPPAYVSTVDSGNLLACLLALGQGLREPTVGGDAARLKRLAKRAEAFAAAIDFRTLYDPARELFPIGFNVSTGRFDPNYYDLLASEACIASFLAVARGEVPRKHWFRLGRLATRIAGRTGLVSWGGTMFEYLMPRLLLPVPRGVLLDAAQRAAVRRQIEFGRQVGLPWGVSESAFAATDAWQVYQYQSFGVPGLGLKRGLDRDRVIAPYACLLAVDLDPAAVVRNLRHLRELGGEGTYGFFEALDFTPDRVSPDAHCRVVKAYMAHHQGMSLVAIANRLSDGSFRRRLRGVPAVRAAELLLEERVPVDAPVVEPHDPPMFSPEQIVSPGFPTLRRLTTPDTPTPRTHLLSNGRYAVMVTNAGGGYSRWRDWAVTRWRADPTADGYGQFVYVRDRQTGSYWSAGYQPTTRRSKDYEVTFSFDKATIRRIDDEIETLMEIAVAPDQDVEARRVVLTNLGSRPRALDVTSYAEVVLDFPAADVAHPAFGKLFVETEWVPELRAVLCRRRPRTPEEARVWVLHLVAAGPEPDGISFDTDRAKLLGRRRTAADPAMLDPGCVDLAGTTGAVLDPAVAVRRRVALAPGERVVVSFITGAAETREAAIALAHRHQTPGAVSRVFELAWAHARIEHHHRVQAEDFHLYQKLAGHLLYPVGPLRAAPATLAANLTPVTGLWRQGLSGDLPIALLRLHGPAGMPVLKLLLTAQSFWTGHGLRADVVVLLENAGGYLDELYTEVGHVVRTLVPADRLEKPGGVFVRKGWQMPEVDRTLLLASARVVLDDRNGSVALQADAVVLPKVSVPRLPRREGPVAAPPTRYNRQTGLRFGNGFGGFTTDGSEYVIAPSESTRVPPAPWANVIANPAGGFVVTDSGGGYCWAGNSQQNRLTPWSNDPVSDPPGDVVYLQDDATRAVWSVTPLPAAGGPVEVRHGQGYTVFESFGYGVAQELTVFMAVDRPVKISLLKLRNDGGRVRHLTLAYYVEWVLGPHRESTAQTVVTELDPETGAVFARNPFLADGGSAVAFVETDLRPRTVTGDRAEFLGRNGSPAAPAAFDRVALSGRVGAGLDPCAALRGGITLAPGEERTVVFLLGQSADTVAARRLLRAYATPAAAEAELHRAVERWDHLCEAVQVRTPDRAFDVLLNRWLPYQTLSCRVWGRSAVYQSGGAYGFRDQLQDVCALVHAAPDVAREHILRTAGRQFVEGDGQHWWHPTTGAGVRTHISDDFMWLPYAACHYTETTGDDGVWDVVVPYLDGLPMPALGHDSFGPAAAGEESGTLFDHCLRAVRRGWNRGPHDLPVIGTGDWNDGMNRVGAGGRGESIWLAWFQIVVLTRFAAAADRRGLADVGSECRSRAEELRAAVERHGWDGAWYRRAFFDDGTPLGSAVNDECKIDSIAQSWAVIAGVADPARAARAMDEVLRRLVRPADRLVLLFTPPFDHGSLQPGYVKGYVPGVRENGGQYTHASTWVVKALAGLGRGDEAYAAFDLLNPVTTTATGAGAARYKGEPYVVAADVYANPPHVGRAGWTWYTGSAGWLYRVGLEDILGIRREGNTLRVDPCIPFAWTGFGIRYRYGATTYHIDVRNPGRANRGVGRVTVDDVEVENGRIVLVDDGTDHTVRVDLEAAEPAAEGRTGQSDPVAAAG